MNTQKLIKVLMFIYLTLYISTMVFSQEMNIGTQPISDANSRTIAILYDNYISTSGTTSDWGFSCFIKGFEKNILFDTGWHGNILLNNMELLEINPLDIEIIMISHDHVDHTGGLTSILPECLQATMYVPNSFSQTFWTTLERWSQRQKYDIQNIQYIKVNELMEVCNGVYTTGEMGTSIQEQSLIVHTPDGQIIITGCAHPGIVNILEKAKQHSNSPILLVAGGFHLLEDSESSIENVISKFHEFEVNYVAPTHCTGDQARTLFHESYQENFLELGVGREIDLDKLQASRVHAWGCYK